MAREVASTAEEVHATVTPVVGWTPRARTQIIIADFYDYSNGWAAPFPNNVITIIPTPPGGSRTNEGDWLRTLILHEYSHILQTDQVSGVPAALRKVFGRIAMPNALAPTWLNEGYAVYNETRFSDFGRLRSAEYDMAARTAADSGRLLPVDRCGTYELQRYPGGSAPYYYGSWLHADVVARSDSGVWDRYNRSRSTGFPFFENAHARKVFGKNIYDLWNETRGRLVADAARASTRISAGPGTQLRQITHEGFRTGSPLWSRYGSRLYYISETGKEHPSIRMIDTVAGKTTVLHRGLVTGNLALSPDGRLLAFSELRRVGDYYEHTEVFALDLTSGKVRQLTYGQRARDPDFASDTSLLAFVSNGGGQNDLKLLDLKTGMVSRLTETEDRTAYSSPRFSPSGRWIAVGVSRPDGYTDIELVDRTTGWTIPVTRDRANDISPAWSRTGKFVYFVSDRTGVFNLYAYQLGTGRTLQVTNVQYGVFEPAVSPDNRRLAVTSYSASGYDISVTDLSATDWQPAPDFAEREQGEARREERTPEGQSERQWSPPTAPSSLPTSPSSGQLYYYNPFATLLPAFWLPWVSLSDEGGLGELGAFTLGWDALQFHQYQLAAGYRFGHSSPFLTAAYTLRRYRPVISVLADLDLHRQEGSVNIELPFLATSRSSWLDFGIAGMHDSSTDARADLDWTYSDAHQYRFDVAPVEGRVVGFHTDAKSRLFFSDRDLTRVLGYWYEYLGNPPQTWSLRSKLVLGSALGDTARDAFVLDYRPGLLGVRGYTVESDPARSVIAAGLQFRTPLWWIERGIGTGPLFLQNINAAAFADAGLNSDWPASPMILDSLLHDTRLGVGAELRTDVIVSHLLPVSFFAGCGFGLNPIWSYRLYFGVTSSMLADILGSRDTGIPGLRHLPETH